jgi:hypothetical protein
MLSIPTCGDQELMASDQENENKEDPLYYHHARSEILSPVLEETSSFRLEVSGSEDLKEIEIEKRVSFRPTVEVFHLYRSIGNRRTRGISQEKKKPKEKERGRSRKTRESKEKEKENKARNLEKKRKKKARKLWYSCKELQKIDKDNTKTIQVLRLGKQKRKHKISEVDSNAIYCARGLYTQREQRALCSGYEDMLKVILWEQQKQFDEGVYDPERLAAVYKNITRSSTLKALHLGLQDEYASRGEEHLLIPHSDSYSSSPSKRRSLSARCLTSPGENLTSPDTPRSIGKLARRWSMDLKAMPNIE